MPTFVSGYVEPGIYPIAIPSRGAVSLPGGTRIVALIGAGSTTKTVRGKPVVKGDVDTVDLVDSRLLSIVEIVDSIGKTYKEESDFVVNSGSIDWSLASVASVIGSKDLTNPTSGFSGKALVIILTGETLSHIFSSDTLDITGIVDELSQDTIFNGKVTFADESGQLKISTVATNNATLSIGSGSANKLLGLFSSQFAQTPQEPSKDSTYFVTYKRAKDESDFEPLLFRDPLDAFAEYGEPNLNNPLSLAIEIAFKQNIDGLMAVQIDPDIVPISSAFEQALNKLKAVDVDYIVPLTDDPVVRTALKSHVNLMSSITERKYRKGVVGLSGNVTVEQAINIAKGLNDRRMTLIWPPSGIWPISEIGNTEIPGYFLAAAYAARKASSEFDVAEPLTEKTINGWVSVVDNTLNSEKRLLGGNGVCVLFNDLGNIVKVRHQKTTSQTGRPDDEEFSVVDLMDFVQVIMIRILKPAFIGSKLMDPTLVAATINAIGMALSSPPNPIIISLTDIRVKIEPTEPRQVTVNFKINPVVPFNWLFLPIQISFS